MTLLISSSGFAADSETPFDLLIRGGTVYDGTGSEGKLSDLAVRGGKIAGFGDYSKVEAKRIVSARGLIVAPGFIDIHTHSDFNPFLRPDSPHRILQGITTEVGGNCGMSAAPLFGKMKEEVRRVWLREGVTIPEDVGKWQSVREYFGALEGAGLATNFAMLVGHGNLRWAAMADAAKAASPGEIEAMKKLLRNAFAEGAFGLSLGLVYLPGTYAKPEELNALAEVVRDNDGLLAVHMRSEGKRLIESVEEILGIAGASRARLEISHLKAAGFRNWSKIDGAFSRIEEAKAKGLEVYSDVYPYDAAFAELGVILPKEIYEAPDRVELLKDPAARPRLKKITQEEFDLSGSIPEQFMIAAVNLPENKPCEGKTLMEIALARKKEPLDTLFDLLAEENFLVSAFSFSQDAEVVKRVVQKDYVSIGSDNMSDFGPKTHPRTFGTFPRFLQWVRDGRVVSLGEGIRKMTGLPAKVLGLKDRGVIVPGAAADIVIFDLEKVQSPATYEEPAQYPSGVEFVIVNGEVAVEKGKFTGKLAGQILRKETNGSG